MRARIRALMLAALLCAAAGACARGDDIAAPEAAGPRRDAVPTEGTGDTPPPPDTTGGRWGGFLGSGG
jgi:hypothetical protein